MAIVDDFFRRIDAGDGGESFFAWPPASFAFTVISFLGESVEMPSMSKISWPVRPRRFASFAGLKFQRQHAHADQIAAVDALEAFGDYRAHAEQSACLWRPSRATSRNHILCRRSPPAALLLRLILHRRRRRWYILLAGRQVTASSRLRCQEPADCAGGCWQTCRASSLRDCRAARRRN